MINDLAPTWTVSGSIVKKEPIDSTFIYSTGIIIYPNVRVCREDIYIW